jgi:hypothetical protein
LGFFIGKTQRPAPAASNAYAGLPAVKDLTSFPGVFAKLYRVSKPVPLWQVVFRDPARLDSRGRARRVRKHFVDRAAAEAYLKQVNTTVVREGTAGLVFDARLRADALAARQMLDAAGHDALSLVQLAERFTAQSVSAAAVAQPIAPQLAAFLHDKAHAEGASAETVKNLRIRLALWLSLAALTSVGEINRAAVECLRTRVVGPATRRNDLNAASSFCSWLLDRGLLDHHPLKGLRRPRVPAARKATWSAEECAAALGAAGEARATLAVMLFAGARPSELAETRLLYGRHPLVRIEGGKLRGRANRIVPMSSALRAYLRAADDPAQVPPLTRHEREAIGRAAGVRWVPDVCRHTCISYRLQLERNDALVARESGTSESIIFRHYHALRTPAEARSWARLRP